jgi:hypoxanthine phosphoribosyltransferase
MSYNSPFDALIGINPEFRQGLQYSGTLDDVLSDVATISSSQTTSATNIWALHPPRIIRALVDYKIQHPNSPEVEALLREAIDVSLGIYSNPDNSSGAVIKLREKIHSAGLEDVLTKPLNQPSDSVTWNATHPSKSQRTAQQLKSQTQSNDVLFIALAHGGVAAGMDVYLRYCDISRSENSAFYVARLSTQKLRDTQLRLSPTEVEYLKALGEDKQIVIFDEDRASGRTIDIAHAYFSNHVFPFQSVITLTNLDVRGELAALGFGKKLMEIDKYSNPYKKHSALTKLYHEKIIKNYNIIDYGLKNNYLNPANIIVKESLNSDPFYSEKSLFGKPKIPSKAENRDEHPQLAQLFPDMDSALLAALTSTKKHQKKLPYSLLDSLK